MEFKDILAISGMPGLYQFIAQGKNGIIVESFDTGKRQHIGAHLKVSSMDDIAVFTSEGEARLKDVFKKIHEMENGGETIDPRSDKESLFAYFEKVLPDFDPSRVYQSDIKKILQWYNTLLKKDLLKFEEEEKEEDQAKPEDGEKTGEKKEKPEARSRQAAGSKGQSSRTTGGKGQKDHGPAGGAKRLPTSTKNK